MSSLTHADITANRFLSNPESTAAFEAVVPHLNRQTAMVVAAVLSRLDGITAEEIEDLLDMPRSSVSARCSELRKRGFILPKQIEVTPPGGLPVYERRKNRSGSFAAVLVWNESKDPSPYLNLLEREVEAIAG